MTRRMRSHIPVAEMDFLGRVAGVSFRDLGEKLSLLWGTLCWKEPVKVVHLVRMPPGCIPMEVFQACQAGRRPPGQAQVQVERLCLCTGARTPRDAPVWVGWCGQGRGSLGPPAETWWTDGWNSQSASLFSYSRKCTEFVIGWCFSIIYWMLSSLHPVNKDQQYVQWVMEKYCKNYVNHRDTQHQQ